MRWTSRENHDRRCDTDTEVAAQLCEENRRARLAADRRDRLAWLDEMSRMDTVFDELRAEQDYQR